MGCAHADKRQTTIDRVRLAEQEDDAVRLAGLRDERRIGQVRRAAAGERHKGVRGRGNEIDPVVVVGMRDVGEVLARAELWHIRRSERLGVFGVRDAVIVPAVGVDAAVDALHLVRAGDEVAVSAQLKLCGNGGKVERCVDDSPTPSPPGTSPLGTFPPPYGFPRKKFSHVSRTEPFVVAAVQRKDCPCRANIGAPMMTISFEAFRSCGRTLPHVCTQQEVEGWKSGKVEK